MTKASESKNSNSRIAALAAAQSAANHDDEFGFRSEDEGDKGSTAPAILDAFAVSAALADAALADALPLKLRNRLAGARPVAGVIAVPDKSWIDAIEDAVRRLKSNVAVVARDGSSRSQHKPTVGGWDFAVALAQGRSVIGVASTPEVVLPSALLSCADFRVDLKPPSGRALRRLLRRFARGPVPRSLDAAATSLTFDELLASFRANSTAREVVAALAQARARKSAARGASDDVPALPDLPGFSGPARAWGEALIDAFPRWRRGDCSWGDLGVDASAVLAGGPGVGKTFFARSLAKGLGVPLHVTGVGEWFARSDGALGGVTQAFQSAWDSAMGDARSGGALLLVDEIDAIPDRATLSDRAREWWSALLAHILTVTDGASTNRDGLVLCGCTNAGSAAAPASSLDAALIRPGRFGKVIWVDLPGEGDLAAVVSFHLGGALSATALLPAVRLGVGASAADAAAWARGARSRAAVAGRAVQVADVVAEIAPPDTLSDGDRRRAAVHEAAHAVAILHLGGRVESASIVPSGRSAGRTVSDAGGGAFPTAADLDRATVTTLAGRAGEQVLLGAPSAGAEGDLAAATALVAGAHASAGMGDSLVHLAPLADASSVLLRDPALKAAVERDVRRAYGQALALIEARRDAVERVADALERKRFLSGAEVTDIVAASKRMPVARADTNGRPI